MIYNQIKSDTIQTVTSLRSLSSFLSLSIVSLTIHFSVSYFDFRLPSATSAVCLFAWYSHLLKTNSIFRSHYVIFFTLWGERSPWGRCGESQFARASSTARTSASQPASSRNDNWKPFQILWRIFDIDKNGWWTTWSWASTRSPAWTTSPWSPPTIEDSIMELLIFFSPDKTDEFYDHCFSPTHPASSLTQLLTSDTSADPEHQQSTLCSENININSFLIILGWGIFKNVDFTKDIQMTKCCLCRESSVWWLYDVWCFMTAKLTIKNMDGYTLTVSSVVATAVESPNWVVSFKEGVG